MAYPSLSKKTGKICFLYTCEIRSFSVIPWITDSHMRHHSIHSFFYFNINLSEVFHGNPSKISLLYNSLAFTLVYFRPQYLTCYTLTCVIHSLLSSLSFMEVPEDQGLVLSITLLTGLEWCLAHSRHSIYIS